MPWIDYRHIKASGYSCYFDGAKQLQSCPASSPLPPWFPLRRKGEIAPLHCGKTPHKTSGAVF